MNAQANSMAVDSQAAPVPFARKPEFWILAAIIALLNAPLLFGGTTHTLIFLPAAVQHGEWWRVITHPFVHVTWYHLLLDGVAFLSLYSSLLEKSVWRRLAVMAAAAAGSTLISCAASPIVATGGFCGLSGVAHGLMAFSAYEMMSQKSLHPRERQLGWLCFILVVGKAAIEAWNGHMFFTFLHFGLMGDPVAVSHAGGVIGGLLCALIFQMRRASRSTIA